MEAVTEHKMPFGSKIPLWLDGEHITTEVLRCCVAQNKRDTIPVLVRIGPRRREGNLISTNRICILV